MASLSSIAAQALQRRILDGEFAQGETLPPQRELAESLGISRTSLREAISMLEALGLVRSQPGKGVYVTAGPQADSRALPDAALGEQRLSPQGLIEFRLSVEPSWTALATQRSTDKQREELRQIQHKMLAALQEGDLVMASEWDLEFHHHLAVLSGNVALLSIADQFRPQIAHSLRLPFGNTRNIWTPADEHQQILDALLAGDAAAAAQAMHDHLMSAARRAGVPLDARIPSPSL